MSLTAGHYERRLNEVGYYCYALLVRVGQDPVRSLCAEHGAGSSWMDGTLFPFFFFFFSFPVAGFMLTFVMVDSRS
jgi:hypothetical protein